MAALGLSNKAVYEDDVNNGPSAELAGSMATYTEVALLMLALRMSPFNNGFAEILALPADLHPCLAIIIDSQGLKPCSLVQGPDLAPNPMPSAVAGPPLEEHLAQNTLWPEVFKLYGHANHIFSMATDPRGAYLASACKVEDSPEPSQAASKYVCPCWHGKLPPGPSQWRIRLFHLILSGLLTHRSIVPSLRWALLWPSTT